MNRVLFFKQAGKDMSADFTIRKNYRNDDCLRSSFNRLAEKTFNLNFENWYQNGFWNDDYNPYSVVMDGNVVSNVSVNRIDMMWGGEKKRLIQLGTVMTSEEYRGRGLIRTLMEEIERDYSGKCDGMFLFANDSVLDLYPRFGLQKADEYQYGKTVSNTSERSVINISMREKHNREVVMEAIRHNRSFYGFDMTDNIGLYMFYLSQFMEDNVYYSEKLKAYIAAQEDDDELFLHAVFAANPISLDEAIRAFGKSVRKVKLGFVPDKKEQYECSLLKEEDTTLFVKGKVLESFSDRKLLFPMLSRA